MKRLLKILAIVIALLVVIAIALPFFIDANLFRPRLESELTNSLGRQVKVGNLSLSLLSGGVKADNISIADDAAFSQSPFVKAKSLKVGVEMIPLILSKTLHVTDLTLDGPEINLVRSQSGDRWNFSSLGSKKGDSPQAAGTRGQSSAGSKSQPSNSSSPQTSESSSAGGLSVAKLTVSNGRLTVTQAGTSEKHVYDKVNIEVTDFSFDSSFPFKLSSNLPSGGNLKVDGKAGPIDANDAAMTPLQAKVVIQQMNLATSGFIDPAAGIAGIADFNGTISSDGHVAKTSGTLQATKLQVSPKGSPAGKPVQIQYATNYDLGRETGTLTQGEVALGKAVSHLTGTYETRGTTSSVNLKLVGQGMPVDDLEAMLPALGVKLPPGSQLKGGTLSTNLAIAGPVNRLVTTGNLKLENSALAGFNLGSKLAAISALSGKGTGGNDTTIQNFSSDVRVAPDGTQASNINLTIPAFGVLTGAGTVSPANALDFKMVANLSGSAVTGVTQLAGLGGRTGSIPFTVQGTTTDPKFVPDVKGMAGGLLQNALKGQGNNQNQQNPLSGLTGLFKKKPPK